MNKLTAEKNQRQILELASKPGNDVCADCKARNPRWASYSLGIFICMSCASIHRKIGTHITKVKSLTMDQWTKEQVDQMRTMGNLNSNAIYNPNETRHPPPANLMDAERDSELESYIRSKYELKRFMNRPPLGKSKLGPSSSTSPANNPRSVSSPLAAPSSSSSKFASTSSNLGAASQLPQRPSTVANSSAAASLAQARSVSQPVSSGLPKTGLSAPGSALAATSAKKPEGVWADLIGLDAPSGNSTLPLQIAAQTPLTAQHTSFPGMQFQNQMNAFTPQSAFTPSFTPSASMLPQQTGFMPNSSFQMQPPMSAPGQGPTQFFQPQPQTPAFQPQAQAPLQIQVPTPGYQNSFTQNGMMSAPAGQAFMSTPSPNFINQTPQPPASTTPTVGIPQFAMQGQGQFMAPTPPLQVPGMSSGFNSNQTMFAQQNQFGQGYGMNGMGAQPQMGMGQFGAGSGQPMYSGGFTNGQQWGAF